MQLVLGPYLFHRVAQRQIDLGGRERLGDEVVGSLLDRLNRVATRAEQTLENYDETGRFSGDARETMREIREAAEAVASLARAIERNPNSIITGR